MTPSDIKIGESNLAEMLPLFAVIVVFVIILIIAIKNIRRISKAKKNQKNEVKELKNKGMTCTATVPHVNGLPVPEGTTCELRSYESQIEIIASGTQFNLEKSKINDICIKTETEIQQQYVSSVGGAVGGAVLFGPLGAMIGGRAKKKKTRVVNSYLIITYTKNNEIQYIGFEVTNNIPSAAKFVTEFKNGTTKNTTVIDL